MTRGRCWSCFSFWRRGLGVLGGGAWGARCFGVSQSFGGGWVFWGVPGFWGGQVFWSVPGFSRVYAGIFGWILRMSGECPAGFRCVPVGGFGEYGGGVLGGSSDPLIVSAGRLERSLGVNGGGGGRHRPRRLLPGLQHQEQHPGVGPPPPPKKKGPPKHSPLESIHRSWWEVGDL